MENHFSNSINCDACGSEYLKDELRPVKLFGFGSYINVCPHCLNRNPEDLYKNSINLLKKIEKIVSDKNSPEKRLEEIRKLIKLTTP